MNVFEDKINYLFAPVSYREFRYPNDPELNRVEFEIREHTSSVPLDRLLELARLLGTDRLCLSSATRHDSHCSRCVDEYTVISIRAEQVVFPKEDV